MKRVKALFRPQNCDRIFHMGAAGKARAPEKNE